MNYDYDVFDRVGETFQYPTECKHEVSILFYIDRDEYNEQLEREKYEMQLLEQRRQREERREKMRQAKLDASAAMQKEREEDGD